MLELTENFSIPEEELEFSFIRSSGPGGQNVNKSSTAAQLRWNIENTKAFDEKTKLRLINRLSFRITKHGDIIIKSDTHRSQERNVQDCLDRLKELILEHIKVPKKRVPTKATVSSIEKRLKHKKGHSKIKALRKKPY
jgi:ribosome-associated protein